MCIAGHLHQRHLAIAILYKILNNIWFFSTMQDGYFILHSNDKYDSLLESVFKTEILTGLTKAYKAKLNQELRVTFSDRLVKVTDW